MSAARLHVAEPSAAYLPRVPLVPDCSVVAGALFNEHWQAEADRLLTDHALHAPTLLQYEISSVALKKARQGHAALSREGLTRFAEADIALHRIDARAVIDLAQRYALSAYDAAYLWLAADLRCPLATFDERLAEAARTHLSSLP